MSNQPQTVNEADFIKSLIQLRPFLKWAQYNNQSRRLDGWAVRQALLTALGFMEYHMKQQGIKEEDIRKFDLIAAAEAKKLGQEIVTWEKGH